MKTTRPPGRPSTRAPEPTTDTRVIIADRDHPHYGETGTLTGAVIQFKYWDGQMALVKLDACRHGVEACYVSPGQITRMP